MEARNYLEEAEGWMIAFRSRCHDDKVYNADAAFKAAMLYIEFAQAEQLKRIADALEPRRGMLAPDAQDFDSQEDYLDALDLYAYRRRAPAGMSYEEWKAQTAGEWGQDTDDEAEARTDYA